MEKDEVCVVVDGFVAELIVMGIFVDAGTETALMLTRIDVELTIEHVELMLHEHVVVPDVSVT